MLRRHLLTVSLWRGKPLRVIAGRTGCLQRIFIKCDREMFKRNECRSSSKADLRTWGSFSWMCPGNGLQMTPSSWIRDNIRSILPRQLLNRLKVLFFDEHFAFHLEIKVCLLEVQCRVFTLMSAMSSIDVCPLFYQVQSQCCHLPGKLWAFHVSVRRSFIEMLLWYLPLLLWYYCAWLANQLRFCMGVKVSYVVWGRGDDKPNNTDKLKTIIKAMWPFPPLHQCHRLITSMPQLHWCSNLCKSSSKKSTEYIKKT